MSDVNDAAVRNYLNGWYPSWRWAQIMSYRKMLRDREMLAAELNEAWGAPWVGPQELYGPLTNGVIAAAVHEMAMQCEDLMALLTHIREQSNFAQNMLSYDAGKVTNLAKKFEKASVDDLRDMYMVPSRSMINSAHPDFDEDTTEMQDGLARLHETTQRGMRWYLEHERFHLQYKHGLKTPLQPFGVLPDSTIESRRESSSGPLFAFTNKRLSEGKDSGALGGVLMFPDPGNSAKGKLPELLQNRGLLRIELTPVEVNLDDLVALSRDVLALEFVLVQNRMTLLEGVDDEGVQKFVLPGADSSKEVGIELRPKEPICVSDFRSRPFPK